MAGLFGPKGPFPVVRRPHVPGKKTANGPDRPAGIWSFPSCGREAPRDTFPATPDRVVHRVEEPKPFWREVPPTVRASLAGLLGSPVRRAVRVFGGYGPSATFRLFLEDGRRVFAKGAGIRTTEHHWAVLPNEAFVYRHVTAIRGFAPAFLGEVRTDGWHLLVLEDLTGCRKVPPWTEELVESLLRDLSTIEVRSVQEGDPGLLRDGFTFLHGNWRRVADDPALLERVAGAFSDPRAGRRWLERALPRLVSTEGLLLSRDQPFGLTHLDIRSDNLCFRDGRLVLFDWAGGQWAPLAADVAGFLPNLANESDIEPGQACALYEAALARHGLAIPPWAVDAAAACVAGYFATRSVDLPIPALPRLRPHQRRQMTTALAWIGQRLGLTPSPAVAILPAAPTPRS